MHFSIIMAQFEKGITAKDLGITNISPNTKLYTVYSPKKMPLPPQPLYIIKEMIKRHQEEFLLSDGKIIYDINGKPHDSSIPIHLLRKVYVIRSHDEIKSYHDDHATRISEPSPDDPLATAWGITSRRKKIMTKTHHDTQYHIKASHKPINFMSLKAVLTEYIITHYIKYYCGSTVPSMHLTYIPDLLEKLSMNKDSISIYLASRDVRGKLSSIKTQDIKIFTAQNVLCMNPSMLKAICMRVSLGDNDIFLNTLQLLNNDTDTLHTYAIDFGRSEISEQHGYIGTPVYGNSQRSQIISYGALRAFIPFISHALKCNASCIPVHMEKTIHIKQDKTHTIEQYIEIIKESITIMVHFNAQSFMKRYHHICATCLQICNIKEPHYEVNKLLFEIAADYLEWHHTWLHHMYDLFYVAVHEPEKFKSTLLGDALKAYTGNIEKFQQCVIEYKLDEFIHAIYHKPQTLVDNIDQDLQKEERQLTH